ncbi:glutamate racemase [Rudaea sp.]|uniref:glutamate racemase n=1 Tax=Rudaea sp. TaxID=2136325 RepID=UPI002ED37A1F
MTDRALDFPALTKPVAVFDAGIGSYAAVAALQRALPRQDLVYFADRASFPYGSKSRQELLDTMRRTFDFLLRFDPAAILVASNAPSITVLDDLKDMVSVQVFGVRPPVKEALAQANGNIAILGVKSLVESAEMRAFAATEAGDRVRRVLFVNASPLVDLVESGAFLFDQVGVQQKVDAFISELDARHADIGAMTLSSTHLPWLRSFLERSVEGRPLLDPLDSALGAIGPVAVEGQGRVLGLVTENDRYTASDFQRMLDRLGIALPLRVVPHPT